MNWERFVTEYRFELETAGPLHIGAEEDELLIDEEAGRAVIPGTSFVGSLRMFVDHKYGKETSEKLFGSEKESKTSNPSILRVQDMLSQENVKIEIRQSICIDGRFGSAKDGGKFERSFVASGTHFLGSISCSVKTEKERDDYNIIIRECFSAIYEGFIRFGAYKSSGGGLMKVGRLRKKVYDLYDSEQFFAFLGESSSIALSDWGREVPVTREQNPLGYIFRLRIRFAAPMLIRGDVADERIFDKNVFPNLDAAPIRDAYGRFYIPGSSWKGSVRHQVTKILSYYGLSELEDELFGNVNPTNQSIGRIQVADALIDKDQSLRDLITEYHGIHIDKLTGGVMNGALRQEQTVWGKATLILELNSDMSEKVDPAPGAILLALRDLAEGSFNLGSGFAGGYGFVTGEKMEVSSPGGSVIIHFSDQSIENQSLADHWIAALEEANKSAAG